MTEYIVKPRDTLWKIARAYNKTVSSLQEANNYGSNTIIRPGQKIIIPDDAGLDTVSFSSKTPANTNQTKKDDSKTYTIKKGDNFSKIEKSFWLKPNQLKSANSSLIPNKLKIGQKVNIPEKEYYLKSVDENDKKFDSLLSKILTDEGGLRTVKGKDGKTYYVNKGITQGIYNRYLKEKAYDEKRSATNKETKDITDKEVKEIYYNYYYLKSGADKETDKKTAYWLMDTAVNCGVGKANELKDKCGKDNDKWYKERNDIYLSYISENADNKKYLNGWLNRIERIKDSVIVL